MHPIDYWSTLRGLTIKDLAKKSGVTDRTIRNIINGVTNPSSKTRTKIAKALKRPNTEDLFPSRTEKTAGKLHASPRTKESSSE